MLRTGEDDGTGICIAITASVGTSSGDGDIISSIVDRMGSFVGAS